MSNLPVTRRLSLLTAAAFLLGAMIAIPTLCRAEIEDGPEMPETLLSFSETLNWGILRKLTFEEQLALRSSSPEQLHDTHPELYARIHDTYKYWTDRWVRRAMESMDALPRERIERAKQTAIDVDRRLRQLFVQRGWPYRTLGVVYLPQRLMSDPRDPRVRMRGMFMPYYPELFFATINPHHPLAHTLIHESIHFNQTGPGVTSAIEEGITELTSEYLAIKWGMVSRGALRKAGYYVDECRLVNFLLDHMAGRTGKKREDLLELLLGAFVTGEYSEVAEILGDESWRAIVRASRSGPAPARKVAKKRLTGSK